MEKRVAGKEHEVRPRKRRASGMWKGLAGNRAPHGGDPGQRRGGDRSRGAEAGTGGRQRLSRLTQGLGPGSVPSRWAGPVGDPAAGGS